MSQCNDNSDVKNWMIENKVYLIDDKAKSFLVRSYKCTDI